MPPRKRKNVNPRAPVPSNQVCAPLAETSGLLEVLDTSDDVLGWVFSNLNAGVYTYRSTTDYAEEVSLPSSPFYSTFQMSVPNQAFPYFGAADAGLGPLGPNLPGYANIVPVKTSPVDSPPSQGDSSESTIWDISCSVSANIQAWKLSVQWTNADGSQPTTYIIYDANQDELLLTGDVDAYNTDNYGQASVVTFAFEP